LRVEIDFFSDGGKIPRKNFGDFFRGAVKILAPGVGTPSYATGE